jgi:hypothetical protein
MTQSIKNQHMDSITIQVINIEQYQEQFIYFYEIQSLLFLSADIQSIEDMYKSDRIVSTSNTQETIIYSYHNGSIDDTTYTTFKFVGLKSYNLKKDKRKSKVLNRFVNFLIRQDIEYHLKVIDIAYDFSIDKSIKNFLPIRINKQGLRTEVNDPFNYYEKTTLYLEDKSIKKPSLRAYIYDKTVKNNLDEQIIRFEISIRNIDSKIVDYDVIIEHIKNQVSKYRLYYFDVIASCNTNKWIYKKNYKISRKLEKSIKKSGGAEVNLSVSNKITDFLSKFFCVGMY